MTKVIQEINTLAASLGISYEEAEDLLTEQILANQASFGNEFIYVECPMTGTIEVMQVEKSK